MAEGLLRHFYPGLFDAWSAGVRPEAEVSPEAILAMQEIGIDISTHRPKRPEAVPLPVDILISVCDSAATECPTFPASERLRWSIADPADATGSHEVRMEVFRSTRDDLLQRIKIQFGDPTRPIEIAPNR